MSEEFRGSYGVTITPFTEDGKKIDIPAWKRFLDWQINEGSPGIIILGTTGEFLTLTDDERTQFVEATIKHVRKRMHVLVGTMNAYTPNAVRYSREAEKLGADGLMIIPPYYYTPTEDEIYRLLQGDLREGLDPDHALQQPVHLQRRHVGAVRRATDRRFRADPLHQGSQPGDGAGLRHCRVDQGRDECVRGPAHRGILSLRRGRLCEPLLQFHPARLHPHLRLLRRGPLERRQEDRATDQQDVRDHPGRSSDLRTSVLFQGACPLRPAIRSAMCARL